VLGGVQLVMIGVLGEYLWRILDEARARPLYILERTIGFSRPTSPSSRPDGVGPAVRSSQ
jgi:dolichol-phosphate mannosyltransferase